MDSVKLEIISLLRAEASFTARIDYAFELRQLAKRLEEEILNKCSECGSSNGHTFECIALREV